MQRPARLLFSIFVLVSMYHFSYSQVSVKDSVFSFTFAGVTGGYSQPGGDLADRFGPNFSIGGTVHRKLRSNWLIGIQGDFIFGNEVRENGFLDDFRNSQGALISQDGLYGTVLLYERGWRAEMRVGKILPLLGPNDNSGLLMMAGAGFIQHKIRIESQGDNLPYLQGEYTKGYDRLTNGYCLSEFIGYVNFGNRRRVNFFFGMEATQGFTQSRRDFDFDLRAKDDRKRNDLLFGVRAGWIIPLYKKIPNAFYYD